MGDDQKRPDGPSLGEAQAAIRAIYTLSRYRATWLAAAAVAAVRRQQE